MAAKRETYIEVSSERAINQEHHTWKLRQPGWCVAKFTKPARLLRLFYAQGLSRSWWWWLDKYTAAGGGYLLTLPISLLAAFLLWALPVFDDLKPAEHTGEWGLLVCAMLGGILLFVYFANVLIDYALVCAFRRTLEPLVTDMPNWKQIYWLMKELKDTQVRRGHLVYPEVLAPILKPGVQPEDFLVVHVFAQVEFDAEDASLISRDGVWQSTEYRGGCKVVRSYPKWFQGMLDRSLLLRLVYDYHNKNLDPKTTKFIDLYLTGKVDRIRWRVYGKHVFMGFMILTLDPLISWTNHYGITDIQSSGLAILAILFVGYMGLWSFEWGIQFYAEIQTFRHHLGLNIFQAIDERDHIKRCSGVKIGHGYAHGEVIFTENIQQRIVENGIDAHTIVTPYHEKLLSPIV